MACVVIVRDLCSAITEVVGVFISMYYPLSLLLETHVDVDNPKHFLCPIPVRAPIERT